MTVWPWAAVPMAFGLGALPFGYWLGLWRGIDVRRSGSGNIGATNVARSLGWAAGLGVLVLDALKVGVPTALVASRPSLAALIAASGILGHVFSPFVGFQGGKGIACLLGASLAMSAPAAGWCLMVFAVVVALTRIVSLGSLAAAVLLPVLLAIRGAAAATIGFGIFAAMLVIVTHRANIGRLRQGVEPRLGRPPAPERP